MAIQAYTVFRSLVTAIAEWNSNDSVLLSGVCNSIHMSSSVSTPKYMFKGGNNIGIILNLNYVGI